MLPAIQVIGAILIVPTLGVILVIIKVIRLRIKYGKDWWKEEKQYEWKIKARHIKKVKGRKYGDFTTNYSGFW